MAPVEEFVSRREAEVVERDFLLSVIFRWLATFDDRHQKLFLLIDAQSLVASVELLGGLGDPDLRLGVVVRHEAATELDALLEACIDGLFG